MRTTPRSSSSSQYRSPSLILLAVALTVGFAMACGSDGLETAPIPGDSPLAGAPNWVLHDCGAHWGNKGGARICGVGSVAGTRNISLMRTAAIGRARAEIVKSLDLRVKSMLEDYMSTTPSAEESDSDREQHIANITEQITHHSLNSATLQDTWVGPDGTLHALVSLDAESFKKSLERIGSLSDSIRAAIKERADAAFRELDEETH